jgi:hypothetical protein
VRLPRLRADRVIYTTITLMSVLVVYDGWSTLSFWGVVAVIVGPMLAVFLGHVFGAALGSRVDRGRRLTPRELRVLWLREAWFLLVVVPPLAILTVLAAVGVAYTTAIQVIVGLGVLTLGVWGAVAGRRAGLSGWGLVASVAYGLMVGGLILGLQAVLQPGHSSLRH